MAPTISWSSSTIQTFFIPNFALTLSGQRRGDSRHGGQFYHCRPSNHIHGTEMFQEGFPSGRADAWDRIQCRGHAQLRAACPVSRNGKAMRLVTDALHQVEPLRVARQSNESGLFGKKISSSCLPTLPPELYRTTQIPAAHLWHRQLSLAAVHDQQVGQECERFVRLGSGSSILFLGRLPALESARQNPPACWQNRPECRRSLRY